jgi:hypothetical protein
VIQGMALEELDLVELERVMQILESKVRGWERNEKRRCGLDDVGVARDDGRDGHSE